MALTRRAFIGALGLIAMPTAAHAHHRPGHGSSPQPAPTTTPPVLTVTHEE